MQKQLLKNRPAGANFLTNISLSPASPAVLKTNELVTVKFDYVFAKGEKGEIFAVPDTDRRASYEASDTLNGAGSNSRWVSLKSAGMITAISLSMTSDSGEELYTMTIPVKYLYK
jgi:hypothetical protein